MQNLIQFLLRTGTLFLFIGLQLICFSLIVRNNAHQQQLYFQFSGNLSARLSSNYEAIIDYWRLRVISDSLMQENARLRQLLYQSPSQIPVAPDEDSLRQYRIIPARVIKNSVNARNNFLVVDRGSRDGVQRGMGVLHNNGTVGIVIATTPHFAKVMSVLHSEASVSAAIKRNNYFGSLVWRSSNPQYLRLEAVPKHAHIMIGDTVVTSGQSVVFPGGVPIGVVDTFWIDRGSSFYSVDVKLHLDISRIDHVYIADYKWASELSRFENNE